MRFPSIKCRNLKGQKIKIPEDLSGEKNIIVVAFQKRHQGDVDSWMPFLERMREKDIPYYEVPVMNSFYRPMRRFIDGGMRAGITDPGAREKTITCYLRKKNFLEDLNLKDDQEIHLYLLGPGGEVQAHAEGPYGKGKEF